MNYKVRFLLLVFFVADVSCPAQSPVLWGTTVTGGLGYGGIFNYSSSQESDAYNFDSTGGASPYGALINGGNGLLYGLASGGGNDLLYFDGGGTLFSYNLSNGHYTDLHDFGKDSDGANPYGTPLLVNDSILYGMTENGGSTNAGIIFSYNINTGAYTWLHTFGNDTDGASPSGSLIMASNGLLYGMTQEGGVIDSGTIFSYNISTGAETVLHSFGIDTDGRFPFGSLFQASDTALYGTTTGGGVNDVTGIGGILFKYDIASARYSQLHDFGSGTDGWNPLGAVMQANNGLLYGLTYEGGVNDSSANGAGTIFSYNISTHVYAMVYSFDNETTDAAGPLGSLIQASDGLLYGTTALGGYADSGTVFSYDISTATETVLYNFIGGIDGAFPQSNLLEVGVATGVKPIAGNEFQLQIYPNPSAGQFNLQIHGIQDSYPAGVYNMLGQKIEQFTLYSGQNTLNLTQQAAGVYFVQVQTENGRLGAKVVVER